MGEETNAAALRDALAQEQKPGKIIVGFYGEDHPQSEQIHSVLTLLSTDDLAGHFRYCMVHASPERILNEFQDFSVIRLPTVVFFEMGKEIQRIEGAQVPSLVSAVEAWCGAKPAQDQQTGASMGPTRTLSPHTATQPKAVTSTLTVNRTEELPKNASESIALNSRLEALVKSHPVMLFIKGSKNDPFCRFSKKAVAILNYLKVDFGFFDVFEDESVRQGMKTFSNWPTFPQLYVKGDFIGGVDIMEEMLEDGSLATLLSDVTLKDHLSDRLKSLIRRAPVMVFMKGERSSPFCRFSRELMDIFSTHGITDFDTFDILTDEDVRQGLKELSGWPTYPQVYVNGELMGGVDVIKQIIEIDGRTGLQAEIQRLLNKNTTD